MIWLKCWKSIPHIRKKKYCWEKGVDIKKTGLPKGKLSGRLQDDSLCHTSWDILDAQFVCLFLSVSKTPPHRFPLSVSIDILVSVFYLLVIAERERERERERDIYIYIYIYKWLGKKLVTEEAGGPFKEWQPLLLVEPKESGSFSAYAFFSFWF